jgi:hypothetical protein
MEDEVSDIANDARCLSAIEGLAAGMDTLNWLGQYLELYMSVIYGQKDHQELPTVIIRENIMMLFWSLPLSTLRRIMNTRILLTKASGV